ncbi:uncharacterized protein LOC8268760 [Ricinus communis]|uniref:uncharacterized protein LOC8268760 n=1 Tax=Ricinus communis TaxID=3988 RepID=UPI00201AA472|nr:uncharacterized protein LOC8268760 [Ricinus communis]
MAIIFRAKSCFASRLRNLTTLQRFNHSLIEQTPLYPRMISSDSKDQQSTVIDISKWKKINASAVGIKRSMIPPSPWLVLKILHNKGFEAYLVGGCVRDLLLNRIPKDFDVITTAKLKQVKKQFHRCEIVGRRFPICRVHVKGSVVEVSSFETVAQHNEGKEEVLISQKPSGCNGRDFIRWRNSMHRDFTINSLFFDPFMNQIFDYANGMADLSFLKLRTVIPARLSFQEDCARILRGLRITGRLGLSISKDTESAIRKLSSSVKSLDKARIMMELNYMLSYGAAESTIYLLQRFNLLELFLPFHAAYLSQQAGETFSLGSVMLMKLFFNLDTLVSCDRPCTSSLWVGLLAFHQALVTNPQDALVSWVFASVLYHGKWKDGVEFARENAKMQVKFAPEISGFSEFKSDEELAEEVSHLASLVQDSVDALMDTDTLAQSMSRFGVTSSSGLVFVSKKIANDVAQLFNVLVDDVESYKTERESFMIDYYLLGKGNQHETRFVLGKVILETLSGGLTKGVEVAEDGPKVIEEKHDSKLSDLVKDYMVEWEEEIPVLSPLDHEHSQKKTGNKRKLVMTKSFYEEKVATKEDVLKNKSEAVAKKPQKILKITQLPELEKKKHHLSENSGTSNLSIEGKVNHEEKKDCRLLLQEVVKDKTENLKQMIKEKTDRPSLYNLFRR